MTVDPRAARVAVVADSLFLARLEELRDGGYGVIQLPPASLDREVAREWIAEAADQVAEYRRTGDSRSGSWVTERGATSSRAAGLATLPALGDGEFPPQTSLAGNPGARSSTPTSSSRSFTIIVDQALPP